MSLRTGHKENARLQFVTPPDPEMDIALLVKKVCEGGGRWVQLRLKQATDRQWKQIIPSVKEVCTSFGATFIINDRVDLARQYEVDGVHLGQEDMSPAQARKILGTAAIIGGTANTWPQVKEAYEQGVDYVGLGPFRYTSTKEKLSPILGWKGLNNMTDKAKKANIPVPMIAIGGIVPSDLNLIMKSGVHGIALTSALSQAEDPKQIAKQLQTKLKFALHGQQT